MTWTRIIDVKEAEVVLKLPADFKNRKVLIRVDDIDGKHAGKLNQMQQAATDPLFLADIAEVQADLQGVDGESV